MTAALGIIDLQRRFRELGRLRMGAKVATRNGKQAPSRLSEWRLTSPSEDLLHAAAECYGGEVRVWEGAPTEGRQFELFTGTDRLDVLVPPGTPLSQSWELWSGGGCERRCNGHARETGEACICPADIAARMALAQKGQACKPTTRFSIVLPRIPDIGVWRVESHGVNAAVELPGTVAILRQATEAGSLIPAQLRIDQRTSKVEGQTRHFVVPALELPTVTTAALLAGEVPGIGPAGPRELDAPAPRALGRGGGDAPGDVGDAHAPALAPAPPPDSPAPAKKAPAKKAAAKKAPAKKLPHKAAAPKREAPAPEPLPGDEEPATEPDGFDVAAIRNTVKEFGPRLTAEVKKTWAAKKWGSIAANAKRPITATHAAAADAYVSEVLTAMRKRSQRIVLACKDAGLDDDGRHALVAYATSDATESSKDVTEGELHAVLEAAKQVESGELEWRLDDDGKAYFVPAQACEHCGEDVGCRCPETAA